MKHSLSLIYHRSILLANLDMTSSSPSKKSGKASPGRKGAQRSSALVPRKIKIDSDLPARTVTQSNELIHATYSLTLNEKRVLLLAASKIDPKKLPTRNVPIRVTADEFAREYHITSRGHAYEALEDAAMRLYDRSIKSVERTRRGIPVEERRWLTGRAVYDEGAVMLEFNEGVLGYMGQLAEWNSTGYLVKWISRLSSFYGVRIYEIAASVLPKGAGSCKHYIDLADLRSVLDLRDKYPSVRDFRRYILDKSLEEITETSNLNIEAAPVRKGRQIIGFELSIETQQQHSLL